MSHQETPSHLIDRLAAIPYTGAISDILDEMGHATQVLPPAIQSLQPGQTLAGRALTVLGHPQAGLPREDYLLPYLNMLGSVQPGDVLVSQTQDDIGAHFGELSAETLLSRGGRGAVLDGATRDTDYIRKLGLPVFCRYRTPTDMVNRWQLLAHNIPIAIGRVSIHPGDYILGDGDGVVIIPASIALEVISRAEEVIRTENVVRKKILEGMHPADAYRLYGRF